MLLLLFTGLGAGPTGTIAATNANDTASATGTSGSTPIGRPGAGRYQPITFGEPEPTDLYDERLVLVLALT